MRGRFLFGLLLAVAVSAIAAGLIALGSPAEARERRLDQRRVDDLIDIDMVIQQYRSTHHVLPGSLNDLEPSAARVLALRDPSTQQGYEYQAIDGERYELCAVFQQPSPTSARYWPHAEGRYCFERRATDSAK